MLLDILKHYTTEKPSYNRTFQRLRTRRTTMISKLSFVLSHLTFWMFRLLLNPLSDTASLNSKPYQQVVPTSSFIGFCVFYLQHRTLLPFHLSFKQLFSSQWTLHPQNQRLIAQCHTCSNSQSLLPFTIIDFLIASYLYLLFFHPWSVSNMISPFSISLFFICRQSYKNMNPIFSISLFILHWRR